MDVALFLAFMALLLVVGIRIGANWARADHRFNFVVTEYDEEQAVNDAAAEAEDVDVPPWWRR